MLLIDTNALLWLGSGSENLGAGARAALQAAVERGEAKFSAISVWETALLIRKGRYELLQTVDAWRQELFDLGLKEVALDGAVAALSVSLPDLHDDPADRFIAATSVRLGAQLVTSDKRLIAWSKAHGPTRAMDARA
ncbi:MAG: type II toxin-antitoxin system VapC family toxin [Hyphomonadaceae bacterium]|nr:type II toxin-antitoxin system VapC family toxin [Hyphomonadaceae bacterium]